MHNNNNIITLFNTGRGDSNIMATVQRAVNSPFIVRSVSISDGFPIAPVQSFYSNDILALYNEVMRTPMAPANLTQSDSEYSSSFYGPLSITNEPLTFIVTAIPTYVDTSNGGNNIGTPVNAVCGKQQTMSSLHLNITVPAQLLNISTGDDNTAYAVTVIMDRPYENEEFDIQPDPVSHANRRVSRTAVGFIIVDGFGSLSFTWSAY